MPLNDHSNLAAPCDADGHLSAIDAWLTEAKRTGNLLAGAFFSQLRAAWLENFEYRLLCPDGRNKTAMYNIRRELAPFIDQPSMLDVFLTIYEPSHVVRNLTEVALWRRTGN